VNYINLPKESPANITHNTYYSQTLNHEVGYNIYLPPEYLNNDKKYPVMYFIHGWQGNESSNLWTLEKTYRARDGITVFINAISSKEEYFDALLQIESILVEELIPHIDGMYRTKDTLENRMISGFSMGGNMAFYYAIKHLELFSSVTAYAGTYHHLYNKEFRTVGVPIDKITELYDEMLKEEWYLEENNILTLVREKAEKIRDNLKITLHIGTADILFCDNEIIHRYMTSLDIPHEYRVFEDMEHNLAEIL